eukprot:TRINITY_DN6710_c0_g1_i1.p1 TRINITY_DN6710_c0_g1~~TRINITY_DN6710_c0_g1_i1.p1  ORF type:complete len:297 (-),score=62.33 TRINITY_DN6710_c0_g1_i1:2305-3150(-)
MNVHLRQFQRLGITLTGDAWRHLQKYMEQNVLPGDRKKFVDKILGQLDTGLVTQLSLPILLSILSESTDSVDDDAVHKFIQCIDCSVVPKNVFNVTTQTFQLRETSKALLRTAEDSIQMYHNRYNMVRQRVARNPNWQDETTRTTLLQTIESLEGSKESCLVLGFILELSEGKYYLEDLNAQISLDFSSIDPKNLGHGLFCEGCLVMVMGKIQNKILLVDTLLMPPVESNVTSHQTFPGIDFFGCQPPTRLLENIKNWETENEKFSIYVLADLTLDNPQNR